MHNNFDNFHIHFIGIGGIGMSGLAFSLLKLGSKVSGSDISESKITNALVSEGAHLSIGHHTENITSHKNISIVVYSSAIKEDNPERQAAKKLGIPLYKRAEMLAELMRIKYGIAIAGTHGKTTTTSMLATILYLEGLNPNHLIGGISKNLHGNAGIGESDLFVVEADESDGSFLHLNPIITVITNIDQDHLDYYKDHQSIVDTFCEFGNRVPFFGKCILNFNDETIKKCFKSMTKPIASFGIMSQEKAENFFDYTATNIKMDRAHTYFDFYFKGEFKQKFCLPMLGNHNVQNCLGAIAAAHHLGLSFEQMAKHISQFKGVERRCEQLYLKDNLEVIDDYAHHPTEIANTLEAIKNNRDSDVIVIFEPHRFSRTSLLWRDFLHCFNSSKKTYLLPIYAASEKPISGINSDRMAEDINKLHPELVTSIKGIDNLKNILFKKYERPTTLVTLGAGSIGRHVRNLIDELSRES